MHAYALGTIFLWATAFPLTKLVGGSMDAIALGTMRCFFAAIFLIAVGMIKKMSLPKSFRDVMLFVLSGALGFGFYMIFFNIGMKSIASSTSSLVIATTPIMTALAAVYIYKEKLSRWGYLTIFTAFVGVAVLLFWDGVFSINVGALWTLGAAVLFCGYNLLNRKLQMMGYSSIDIMTYSMISAAIILVIASPHALGELMKESAVNIALVVYMGIGVSAMGYFLWAKAFECAPKTGDVTIYMFMTPLVSTILAVIILGEVPDMGTFVGGFIIIASVIVFNRKGRV